MPTAATGTVRLHRVLRAPAERVYRAFLEPEAMAKWLPPHGFTGKVDRIEARVGGSYHMSFTNFGTGKSHAFGGTYVELVPNKRIVHTDKFEDETMGKGTMTVTIELKPVKDGTEVTIVQAGIPKGPAAAVPAISSPTSFIPRSSTASRASCRWPTPDATPMEASSS